MKKRPAPKIDLEDEIWLAQVHHRFKMLLEDEWGGKRKLAHILGIHEATIGRYSLGQRAPSMLLIRRIVIRTCVSSDWLLWGRGPACVGVCASCALNANGTAAGACALAEFRDRAKGVEGTAPGDD